MLTILRLGGDEREAESDIFIIFKFLLTEATLGEKCTPKFGAEVSEAR